MVQHSIKAGFASAALAIALAGCVKDADYGVIARSPSGLFVEQLTVPRDGDYSPEYFSRCVGRHARYYPAPKNASAVTSIDNGRTVQLIGNTRWRFAFVDRMMTFQLTAQYYNARFYTFETLKSGALADGVRGAVWPLAARGPEGKAGLQALVDVVDKIEQCQRDSVTK